MGGYPGGAPVMKPAFWQELARENPLGMTLTAKVVQDWFYITKWPGYKAYQYTSHKRAIMRWWSRVTEEEIEAAKRARARMDGIAANQPRYWTGHAQQKFEPPGPVSMGSVIKEIL